MKRTTLPLLAGLLLLGGCMDRELPTAVAPEAPALNKYIVGCSVTELVATIDHANANPGPHEIYLSPGCTYVLANVHTQFFGNNGLMITSDDLTILGNGATITRNQTFPFFRILFIANGATVWIDGLTITGGEVSGRFAEGDGGGIYNLGRLTLSNSTVSNNYATGLASNGGGILSAGGSVLTITNSNLYINHAEYGAGIYNHRSTLTLTNSAVYRNTAGRDGGGIVSGTASVTHILNSTLSDNTAGAAGGAVYTFGSTRISHSTISENRAATGGGVRSSHLGSGTDVKNSIIWGNTLLDNTTTDDVARSDKPYNSLGWNLIGTAGANVDFSQEFNDPNDFAGVFLPLGWLGPLQNNGGPTPTHALESGHGVEVGTCTDFDGAPVTTDQRGIRRPQIGRCDIGAYELFVPGSGQPPVNYRFEGFAAPVKNPEAINVVKAGQAVPLKWRLLDAQGRPVTDLGGVSVSVSDYPCGLGTTPDQPEEQASGRPGLLNKRNGNYQFNWKTPKSYAGSCKEMTLTLHGVGISRLALFKFTR